MGIRIEYLKLDWQGRKSMVLDLDAVELGVGAGEGFVDDWELGLFPSTCML